MKKKNILLCLFSLLSSCGNSKGIDCYSITVLSGGKAIFQESYSSSSSFVYEYYNYNGVYIYTDFCEYPYYNPTDDEKKKADIIVYPDKDSETKLVYTYSRKVGSVRKEENYYYNSSTKTIDAETEFSKEADQEEAYRCIKKGGYYVLDYLYGKRIEYSGNGYVIRQDRTEKSLERHYFVELGDDSIVSYDEKRF